MNRTIGLITKKHGIYHSIALDKQWVSLFAISLIKCVVLCLNRLICECYAVVYYVIIINSWHFFYAHTKCKGSKNGKVFIRFADNSNLLTI